MSFHNNEKEFTDVWERALFLGILLLSVVAAVIFIGIKVWTNETSETTNKTSTLKPVEIREYKGQRLSSIDDFRENSIKGPQHVDEESYELIITGIFSNTVVYTYGDVVNNHKHYEKVVTLHCVEGWEVTILWEGVLVKDLMEEAGIGSEAKVVIFYASDGYSTSLPFDYIIDTDIIMAYKMNGVVLPPERGFPFSACSREQIGI